MQFFFSHLVYRAYKSVLLRSTFSPGYFYLHVFFFSLFLIFMRLRPAMYMFVGGDQIVGFKEMHGKQRNTKIMKNPKSASVT